MVKLAQTSVTEIRGQRLIDILESKGELDTDSLAKISGENYHQVRRTLQTLLKKGEVVQSNTIGRKLYFRSKRTAAIPMFEVKGQWFTIMNLAEKSIEGIIKFEPNTKMRNILNTINIQPIWAKSKNSIEEDNLIEYRRVLSDLIVRLENLTSLLRELLIRGFPDDVDTYREWYDDQRYDAVKAFNNYLQSFDEVPASLRESVTELVGNFSTEVIDVNNSTS